MVSSGKKSGLLLGFGAVTVVLGAIMVVFWPPIFNTQLQRMMTLTNESMSFNIWRETPIPMYLEIHFFNISNVDEILARKEGVRLRVDELGPYVFRETHIKTNLTWNDNSTLTFYNQRWWHFVPEKSVGELSDMITSINPIIATVAYLMRHQRLVVKVPVDIFLRLYHSNMFLTANVTDWLFDGISDPVLDIASHFPELPIDIPYDKFGWFYERNGSIEFDGSFTMNTGAADFSQLGNVEKWRYSNRTEFRDECGVVKGSTGELWAPEYGQEEVYVFTSDLCTYLTLSKDREVIVQGVEGVQYAANDSTFDNGHKYPHMACFCDEPTSSPDCLPSGALNVSACRFGAPAFVSLPHFLNTDPHYPSKIDGLNATDDMNFRLILEMFTGMPLGVSAQLQINLLVRHVTGITINNQLPDGDTMVPMFWFRQEMETTPEYARMAQFAIRMRYWVPYGLYALTAIGVVLLIAGITVLMRKLLKSPETAPILNEESSSSVES
ncbi:protein croquemort-like [Anticarsia gemmatalis]|uniref:protein croquemort-like n=1 Tax=Anticarsia gemmatalis TaxID=129554 RepID=UPI003F761F72